MRHLSILAGPCIAFLWLAHDMPRARAAQPRPNVLVLIGDDHAAYALGADGNRLVRTPHLDRLAAQSVRFSRAYCNAPVCTASRQSFLTGKLPHTVGVTLLRTALADEQLTLAELLAGRGYATRAYGKMHFNRAHRPGLHGFEQLVDNREYRQWLPSRPRATLPPGLEVLPQWKPFRDPARMWLNGFYRPLGRRDADMLSTFVASEAAKFIEAEHEKPFLTFVSFREPHSPFRFPVEYAGMFDPTKLPVGRIGPEDGWQIPAEFRNLTPAEKRGIVASYYTSVSFLDAKIGTVLAALERSGQADNTLVFYFGDHGYSLGHHGRFEKHCFFEPAIRVPLLVRFPGRYKAGRVSDAFVELADVMPTVLEACGLPTPDDLWGRSLVPVLTGERTTHRDFIFAEYQQNDEAMIRTDRYKLIYERGQRQRTDGYKTGRPLPGRTWRLYDMKNDPDEMHNLAQEPDHLATVTRLQNKMLDVFAKTQPDPSAVPKDLTGNDLLDWYVQPHDPPRAR